MVKKEGKELSILFTLVAFVVLVNTSFMFITVFSDQVGFGESTSIGQISVDSSSSREIIRGVASERDGQEVEVLRLGVIYSSSSNGGGGDDSDDDAESDNDDDKDENSSEDENDGSGDGAGDDDSNDGGSYGDDEGNVEYNLDEVPENEDGPPAENVEGRNLEFNFGFGGFG